MKELLQSLFAYKILSRAEAKKALIEISQGKYSEYEITAFVTVFKMRSIAIAELQGFTDALLELALPVDLGSDELIDIVGTGGDGKNTFNISTLSSFVVAGAGGKVAKQGNYGASSVSGSSNVLELLGYRFKNDSASLRNELDRTNICFMHAPLFHPALKAVGPMRKSLGFRTFFNLLGPLVNPARPKYQNLGVYSLEAERQYTYYLQESDKKFSILFSLDGYDEISLTGDTKIITNEGEKIWTPEQLGKIKVAPQEIYGGDTPAEAADKFRTIISGKGTPAQNAVIFANAAIALFGTGQYSDYSAAFEAAKDSLLSGKAQKTLNDLIALQ